ncbi:MAG: hypothetical protein R3344_15775, partial [Acidobacteriota bacterium]|nr:hypothetical protein [Acidobacteriota bacterium]
MNLLFVRNAVSTAVLMSMILCVVGNVRAVTTYHNDHRRSLKLDTSPNRARLAGLTGESLARAYIQERSAELGIAPDLGD